MFQRLKNLFGSRQTPANTGRRTPKLGVESLEARDVPAYVSVKTLVIEGTNGPDNVLVTQTIPANRWEQAMVKVVQNGYTQTFSNLYLRNVRFNGYDGNDIFAISASLFVTADGGRGNDVLSGGPLDDTLIGGTGNDAIYGNEGNDRVEGGQGTDELRGGYGNDVLYGGEDGDTMRGGPGDDLLYGGAGNDTIYGDNNAGTAGGVGNDTLYGEAGNDYLYGEGGNDGLFGGTGDGADYLYGGAGADRLLVPATRYNLWYTSLWYTTFDVKEDVTPDLAAEDAQITFRNSPALSGVTLTGQSGTYSFATGSWTNADIQRVDVALANLQSQTGNTRLLKKADRGEMSFLAVGMQTDANAFRASGWNDNGQIAYVNLPNQSNMDVQKTVYHEFGHNWDDVGENPYVTDFQNVSGWQTSPWALSGPGKVDDGYLLSTDAGGTWEYRASAANTFAKEYGKTNPFEDMATTWEAYFVNRYHGGADTLTSLGLTRNDAKWATIDSLFGDLRSAP